MNINTQYHSDYTPAFKSKNASIRTADEICRRVNKEFPVYSNTFLQRFKTIHKTHNNKKIYDTVSDLVVNLREYYHNSSTPMNYIIKLLNGMKKSRVGNCHEQSIAASVALRANGYKNVTTLSMYSINPKTLEVKDLDHAVAAIDFKLPKGYKYCNDKLDQLQYKQLLKANNEAIIVDPWAGITDNAKSIIRRYKTDVALNPPLSTDDTIVFLPNKPLKIDEQDIEFFKEKYPALLLNKNKATSKNPQILNDEKYKVSDMPDSTIHDIKAHHHLKSAIGEKTKEDSSFFSTLLSIFSDPTSWFGV